MDRNKNAKPAEQAQGLSLSARRAWIEMFDLPVDFSLLWSLSARRAWIEITDDVSTGGKIKVALRKESVDRNVGLSALASEENTSLSARRAWIEISYD